MTVSEPHSLTATAQVISATKRGRTEEHSQLDRTSSCKYKCVKSEGYGKRMSKSLTEAKTFNLGILSSPEKMHVSKNPRSRLSHTQLPPSISWQDIVKMRKITR